MLLKSAESDSDSGRDNNIVPCKKINNEICLNALLTIFLVQLLWIFLMQNGSRDWPLYKGGPVTKVAILEGLFLHLSFILFFINFLSIHNYLMIDIIIRAIKATYFDGQDIIVNSNKVTTICYLYDTAP